MPGAGGWLVRHRRAVALVWLAAGLGLLPALAALPARLSAVARVEGSESAAVETLLQHRLTSPFAKSAVLTIDGLVPGEPAAQRRALMTLRDAAAATPGITGTFSRLDIVDTIFAGEGGGTFLVAGLAADADPDRVVPALRARTGAAAAALRTVHPRLAVAWTGELALNHDLRLTSAADARRAEARVLPLTLLLLVIAFGAITAALLPVVAGAAAILLALALASLVASHWPLSVLLQSVVSMLGLGLGIDYALLVVTRFRVELAAGRSAHDAAELAARHAGGTILISASAVSVGFVALLLIPSSELRSIAVGGLAVTFAAAALACTLLPGALAVLGGRIDLGRVRARRPGAATASGTAHDRWFAWGRLVTRHPLLAIVAAALPLLWLAAQSRHLRMDTPRGDWLPPAMESARGAHALGRMHRTGVIQTIRVVVQLPPGTSVFDEGGWRAVDRVGRWLSADSRIARVRSLPAIVGGARPNLAVLSLLPEELRRSLTSDDGSVVLVEAVPRSDTEHRALVALVRELRGADPAVRARLRGVTYEVGGMPAFTADYEDAVKRSTPLVVLLVLAGTFVALLLAFRSVLIPIKAILLNLLSVAGAFGAVAVVFQSPRLAPLLGLAHPLDGMFPAVPPIVFCIVFGLSKDYEVFLVARVAEARRDGLAEREAIAEGLARTASVITGAAAIMLVVFAAFLAGDFLLMRILGFALAAAVAIDATLVRMLLGPALLAVAGRWNWWPGAVAAPAPAATVSLRPVPAVAPGR